jgi:hypothetical protein
MFPLNRPHRLEAQDAALSRPKQGFESPWGHRTISSHRRDDSLIEMKEAAMRAERHWQLRFLGINTL